MYEEDKNLAKQLISGNERAFDTFFNEYYSRVFRFCMRRVQEADAEDIAIETMRHAIKRIETYRAEASLITWVYQVARSQVSAHYKRQKKHQNLVLIEDNELVRAEVESMTTQMSDMPDGLHESERQMHLVHFMLDSLPGDYGRILEWKYVEGFSVDEIAAKLESTPTAIQSMLARARQAFRTTYRDIADQLQNNAPVSAAQTGDPS